MGEEDQEQKHVCKFCKKSFPCGRSLGGHMRSHMINNNKNSTNSAAAAEAKNNNNKKKLLSSVNELVEDFEGEGGHVGYVLRENPKKTWRLSDSIDETHNNNNHCGLQEKLCKECGKGFQSWKALFGHMRCHSDKEKISNYSLDGNSWNAQNQKLVIDSQSDNEGTAAAPRRRRRSRRTRFRTTTIKAAAATVTTTTTTTTTTTAATTTTSSFSFANASPSSASEIEQEQEEVALCLMMLSRDVGCWRGGGGGLNNSVADSSDNNSVVVEVRSSGLVKRITETEDWNAYESNLKMKQSVVSSDLENGRFERKVSEIGASNFGVVKNGFNKINSEVSVDGFFGEDKIKNPRQDDEVGIEASDAELGKNINCQDDLESGGKCDLSKKSTGYDPFDLEIGKVNCSLKKTSKFECTTCNKIFHSYQALGGHRASHKKIKGCYAAKTETSENSIETDVSPDPIDDIKLIKSCENQSPIGNGETSNVVKRSKHECPICLKIFASGQALGGHKRSHVVENNEARGNQSNVIQQNLPEIRDLLDLNLPAPIDQEDANSSHVGLKPWWIESKHKRESVIAAGVISN